MTPNDSLTGMMCYMGNGLSTVFGTSQCKQYSNVCLLIVFPIAIAGIVLVLLLLILLLPMELSILSFSV